MSYWMSAVEMGFWVCLLGVVYAYAGYPIVLWCASRWFGKSKRPAAPSDAESPTVALLIAAYNEESVIEQRLRNALQTDYPADKFEIVIACDGCSDGTAEVVRRLAQEDRRIRLLDYAERGGKASVLNRSFPQITADVVMLSDANTWHHPLAARKLARWFADPEVAAVCGGLVLEDPRTGRNVDGLYWKYETFLKQCESRLDAVLGANGGIYALRRESFEPIPRETIVDDFVIPLLAKLKGRGTIVYDREAAAWEETPPEVGSEFRRRARIGAGDFQSLKVLWPLLNPGWGWLCFCFASHKLLRWICPFLMAGAMAANLLLWDHDFYRGMLALQAAFYGLAASGVWASGPGTLAKFLRLNTLFCLMNAALALGFWRLLTGRQRSTWQPTQR